MINYLKTYLRQRRIPFFRLLQQEISDGDRVLDVGCGNNSIVKYLNRTIFYWGVDSGINFDITQKHPYASMSSYHKLLIDDFLEKFRYLEFDVIVLSDFIEHLPKKEALELLAKLKTVSNKILLQTPLGFMLQESVDYDKGNIYQEHKSAWYPQDLKGFQGYILPSGIQGKIVAHTALVAKWVKPSNKEIEGMVYDDVLEEYFPI